MKQNKDVSDEKLLKVGLGIGKGELRLEGFSVRLGAQNGQEILYTHRTKGQ